jgi:predicted esterase
MEKKIRFRYEARYYTLGNPNEAKQVWFVLHGYGQLARFFIHKFRILEQHNIFIIAPEGLSKFYLEDIAKRTVSGNMKVGATWMTREDRERDISNYLTFLNSVYQQEMQASLPVTILGFSQGAATASRWIADGIIPFQRLILWGGVLPPDLNITKAKEVLKERETILVIGKNDPFMKPGLNGMHELTEKLNLRPSIVEYDGGHDIDENTLVQLI